MRDAKLPSCCCPNAALRPLLHLATRKRSPPLRPFSIKDYVSVLQVALLQQKWAHRVRTLVCVVLLVSSSFLVCYHAAANQTGRFASFSFFRRRRATPAKGQTSPCWAAVPWPVDSTCALPTHSVCDIMPCVSFVSGVVDCRSGDGCSRTLGDAERRRLAGIWLGFAYAVARDSNLKESLETASDAALLPLFLDRAPATLRHHLGGWRLWIYRVLCILSQVLDFTVSLVEGCKSNRGRGRRRSIEGFWLCRSCHGSCS